MSATAGEQPSAHAGSTPPWKGPVRVVGGKHVADTGGELEGASYILLDAEGYAVAEAWGEMCADAIAAALNRLNAPAPPAAGCGCRAFVEAEAKRLEREWKDDHDTRCCHETYQRGEIGALQELAAKLPAPPAEGDRIYPCDWCGKMRTKAEGGTVFTVCDECWHAPPAEGRATAFCTAELRKANDTIDDLHAQLANAKHTDACNEAELARLREENERWRYHIKRVAAAVYGWSNDETRWPGIDPGTIAASAGALLKQRGELQQEMTDLRTQLRAQDAELARLREENRKLAERG